MLCEITLNFTPFITKRTLKLWFFAAFVLLMTVEVGVTQVRPVATVASERALESWVVAEREARAFRVDRSLDTYQFGP